MTLQEAISEAKMTAARLNEMRFVRELNGTWSVCDRPEPSHFACHPEGDVLPLSRYALFLMKEQRQDQRVDL